MKYINLDNNNEIEFEVADEKRIIAIYGKNGVGKTTFSTSDFWNKSYVFNEVFVRENIYVTTDSGINTTVDNKKNLSSLFIGKDIVDIQRKLENLNKNKRDFKNKQILDFRNIQTQFEVNISDQEILSTISNLAEQIKSLDPYLEYSKLNNSLPDIVVDTPINNETMFLEQMKIFNSRAKLQSFIALIETNQIFSSAILGENSLDPYLSLISEINELSKLHDSKKKIDDFLKKRKLKKSPSAKLIKEILQLQGENEVCILCGSENRVDEIKKWNEFLSNKYKSKQAEILKKFKQIQDTIGKVNEIRNVVENETPKIFKFLDELNKEVTNIIDKIKKDNFEVKSTLKIGKFETIAQDAAQLKKNLILYEVSKKSKEIIGTIYQLKNIETEIRKLKKDLDSEMQTQKDTIVNDVNGILHLMQINKPIQINIDRRSGEYKYAFTIDGKDVDTLSEGQRHKLALAFFIASIKKMGIQNQTVIFDDPVVSLDELGYHVLKDVIINLRKDDSTVRVIILTHNIFYLYVQLSNVFNNETIKDITAFFRMNSTEIKEYEIDSLRIDDLTLFKKCYRNITSVDELLIVAGIVPKIFRQFIDLSLRFKGILFQNDPNQDIKALELQSENEKKLLQINRNINKIFKHKSKVNVEAAKELIRLLRDAVELLGFKEYFSTDDLSKISNFVGKRTILDSLSSKDIYFDMIDAVNDVLYRDCFPELRGYLIHPRQQITKQITSISNDF